MTAPYLFFTLFRSTFIHFGESQLRYVSDDLDYIEVPRTTVTASRCWMGTVISLNIAAFPSPCDYAMTPYPLAPANPFTQRIVPRISSNPPTRMRRDVRGFRYANPACVLLWTSALTCRSFTLHGMCRSYARAFFVFTYLCGEGDRVGRGTSGFFVYVRCTGASGMGLGMGWDGLCWGGVGKSMRC